MDLCCNTLLLWLVVFFELVDLCHMSQIEEAKLKFFCWLLLRQRADPGLQWYNQQLQNLSSFHQGWWVGNKPHCSRHLYSLWQWLGTFWLFPAGRLSNLIDLQYLTYNLLMTLLYSRILKWIYRPWIDVTESVKQSLFMFTGSLLHNQ